MAAARAGGRGVIVVSGHFTTLEVCGRLMCDHVPLAGMYRPHAQPALEWAVRRGRARYAAAMFPKQEVRGAVKHLKRGGRSEEHTSELRSLMSIPYAVFGLK